MAEVTLCVWLRLNPRRANSTVVYGSGAIMGQMLTPKPEPATVPVFIFVIGMAAVTLPAGVPTRWHGPGQRRCLAMPVALWSDYWLLWRWSPNRSALFHALR